MLNIPEGREDSLFTILPLQLESPDKWEVCVCGNITQYQEENGHRGCKDGRRVESLKGYYIVVFFQELKQKYGDSKEMNMIRETDR